MFAMDILCFKFLCRVCLDFYIWQYKHISFHFSDSVKWNDNNNNNTPLYFIVTKTWYWITNKTRITVRNQLKK
jgi:hypothetical protein